MQPSEYSSDRPNQTVHVEICFMYDYDMNMVISYHVRRYRTDQDLFEDVCIAIRDLLFVRVL